MRTYAHSASAYAMRMRSHLHALTHALASAFGQGRVRMVLYPIRLLYSRSRKIY